jgi:hypothetical protein
MKMRLGQMDLRREQEMRSKESLSLYNSSVGCATAFAALGLLLIAGRAVEPDFNKPATPDVSDYTAGNGAIPRSRQASPPLDSLAWSRSSLPRRGSDV